MTSAPQGGYRQPSNPAPVSGPGALSKRTDGGATEGMTQPAQYISGLPWGEGQSTYDQQTSAPMAGSQSMIPDVVPLSEPSMRPREPITSGIDLGAGVGSEALMSLPQPDTRPSVVMRQLAQYDPSGDAELISQMLEEQGF